MYNSHGVECLIIEHRMVKDVESYGIKETNWKTIRLRKGRADSPTQELTDYFSGSLGEATLY